MYINDLPSVLTNPCLLFADDTKVYSCITNDNAIERLQHYIVTLEKWSEVWKMPINILKCKIWDILTQIIIYSMGGRHIKQTTCSTHSSIMLSHAAYFINI